MYVNIVCVAPLLSEDSPSAIDGEYLVVFHDSVTAEEGLKITNLEERSRA